MSDVKKYYWLKLKRDFFKRHDIKIIESMDNGKDYVLFYLKLLLESVDHEGELRFSATVPYNDKMLATITDTNIDIVRSAVKIFSELGMMDRFDDGTLYMDQVTTMLGFETSDAIRMRETREKKKQLLIAHGESEQCSKPFENRSPELELELDKEIDKEEDTVKPSSTHFQKPTLEEVEKYCLERRNGIDASRFLDYYESKGWLIGKTKMKDWQAAVRTWERSGSNTPAKPREEHRPKSCPKCGAHMTGLSCPSCYTNFDSEGNEV